MSYIDEFRQPSIAVNKPKEHVRVVTKSNAFFDMDKPADFDMVVFMTNVRANGCILNKDMYVPLDWLATVFVWNDALPPQTMVLANAPAAGNA